MAFNPKYCSIPLASASDNIGMPDLPVILPSASRFKQYFDSLFWQIKIYEKGWASYLVTGGISVDIIMSAEMIRFGLIDTSFYPPVEYPTLNFRVEPPIYPMESWCKISAYDSTRYNYSSYPLVVYFKADTRKIEQQNVVIKYDDEVGTIIPLSQKQFDVLTFTTQPMNSDYARLLLDIAEWDNVTFQHWDTNSTNWSSALNVVKKAEAWNKTTYPKTLGTTIQGSFVIKQ